MLRNIRAIPAIVLAIALATPYGALEAATARKPIKPGMNFFSKEQDVQMGREAAVEIEKEVELVNDKQLNDYVTRIGNKLAKNSQDPDYPFTFKVVADDAINAFALPGGPIYIHTGLIKAADNEAELAGVLGHEIGHVVLRHSTNQASKASLFQLPAMLAGGLLDKEGGMLAGLAQLGLGLGLNSALLSYSRKAEHDSDIVGARMLAASGYNPVSMASFFEKLEAASGGQRAPQFFSSHPNPGNRVEYVTEEIEGYRSGNYTTNTADFPKMKARAEKIQPSKKSADAGQGSSAAGQPGDGAYAGNGYQLEYPKGWREYPGNGTVTIAPDNGLVQGSNGATAIARGVMAGWFDSDDGQSAATTALIQEFEGSNDGLQAIRGQRRSMKIGGRQGESVFLQGKSPIQGQTEYVWMVTSAESNRLFYLLLIAPESDYNNLRGTFEEIVRSIDFP